MQLFHLYHNEKDIQNAEEELQHKQSELAKVEKKRQKAEDALKEKKKETGAAQRELAKIEQEIREVVSAVPIIFFNVDILPGRVGMLDCWV